MDAGARHLKTLRLSQNTGYRNFCGALILLIFLSLSGQKGFAQERELTLTYLGAAGWEISNGNTVILVDPYISRVKREQSPLVSYQDLRKSFHYDDSYKPDTAAIDSIITRADFILVHHSHFDHIADVPYIAKKTGAKVIGSATSYDILEAYGVPWNQIYPVRGGEDYQFETFSVRVIPSLHSALNNKFYFDDRKLSKDVKAPLKMNQFVEGGSFMFLIRINGRKVLTMGSHNFIENEIDDIRPDILLMSFGSSREEIYNYSERLLRLTGYPDIIFPTHWDNFMIPFHFPQTEFVEKNITPFLMEMKDIHPNAKIIIPKHLEPVKIKE